MNRKIQDYFIDSAAVILFVTATAKIFTATGTAQALSYLDLLIRLPNRQVFYVAGCIELAVSAFLLLKQESQSIKLALIAWLVTNLAAYRVGIWWLGAPNLCDCLGNLNDRLPISPRTINDVMLGVLTWLLAGSYLLLILDRFGRRMVASTDPQGIDMKA